MSQDTLLIKIEEKVNKFFGEPINLVLDLSIEDLKTLFSNLQKATKEKDENKVIELIENYID